MSYGSLNINVIKTRSCLFNYYFTYYVININAISADEKKYEPIKQDYLIEKAELTVPLCATKTSNGGKVINTSILNRVALIHKPLHMSCGSDVKPKNNISLYEKTRELWIKTVIQWKAYTTYIPKPMDSKECKITSPSRRLLTTALNALLFT